MYPSIEAENLPHFDLIFKEIVGGVYHPAIRLYSAPGRLLRIGELSFQRGATHHNPGNAEEVSTTNKAKSLDQICRERISRCRRNENNCQARRR